MKLFKLKTIITIALIAFGAFYLLGVALIATREVPYLAPAEQASRPMQIAILGASGTAGDGILEAALAADEIDKIQVITRRITPRIQAGVDRGKIEAVIHLDYLDYSAIADRLVDLDAVFWAIGISSLGVDEETYGRIHVDFPAAFLQSWIQLSTSPHATFHFISSSDIAEDSSTMWVREKIRAEKTLFALASKSHIRAIGYRPDYIGPTEQQAHLGQKLLYWFFRPVGAAVKASEIGKAMIDVSLRKPQIFPNGSTLSTPKIVRHAQAYANTVQR